MPEDIQNHPETREIVDLDYSNFGERLVKTIFTKKQKLKWRVWTFASGQEICIASGKVKMGVQQFEWKRRLYNIDYSAIQLQLGDLVYNTHVHNAIGSLRFRAPEKNVDSKNAKELLQRTWLTALWGSWKMPLIVALIAVMGCVILAVILAIFLPKVFTLQDENKRLQTQIALLQGLPDPNAPPAKPTNNNNGSIPVVPQKPVPVTPSVIR